MKKEETVRLTLEIPKKYHRRLKSFAATHGKTIKEVVVDSTGYIMDQEEQAQKCNRCHELNEDTIQVIEEARQGKGLIRAKDLQDLFKKLRA